ncbi:hypothetical protein OV208_27025 [Corallococcus sp. bb12-1]|uniref:hypothetical protein n=1 Tax=Corallococcus sp. bb12-1 TaxID=2996784 RepID=UPI00227027F6|nr:hypothetical protein [Corallococcus sp. bb12-1]MCY1044997.1 hypothetical protein [Corallococcus sp. bb12-1]
MEGRGHRLTQEREHAAALRTEARGHRQHPLYDAAAGRAVRTEAALRQRTPTSRTSRAARLFVGSTPSSRVKRQSAGHSFKKPLQKRCGRLGERAAPSSSKERTLRFTGAMYRSKVHAWMRPR